MCAHVRPYSRHAEFVFRAKNESSKQSDANWGEFVMAITTARGAGPRYDVRPSSEFKSLYGGPLAGLAATIKDAAQGAGAGFLSLTGATTIASGETMAATGDLGLLGELWPALATNGMSGPVQLVGGVLLFLAARRTISRTAGLLIFLACVVGYSNGYTLADMLSGASAVLEGAAGALETIPASENA
jgi:hypothetical protein